LRRRSAFRALAAILLAAALALALGCNGESGSDEQVLGVTINWATSHNLDIALRLPDGTLVDKTNLSAGGCSHQGDDTGSAGGGTETVRCAPPQQTGRYQAVMMQFSGPAGPDPVATLFIDKDGVVTSQQETLPVAATITRDVTYP
jgi:hypothetical protein